MISDLAKQLNSLDFPADWMGVRVVKETISRRSMRDGVPASNHTYRSQGAMVEAMVNGQIGYCATNTLTPEGLQAAAKQAYDHAIAASQWGIHAFTLAVRPKVVGHYYSPLEKSLQALSIRELSDVLVRICQGLKVSDQIVQAQATAVINETESWFVSTNGSDVYQRFHLLSTDFAATAQDGPVVQNRSNHGELAHSYQGGWELFPDPHLWDRVQQIGEQAVQLLTVAECPTETTTLVLAPDQMMLQIHESIGHPLELDRILGDERNYAGGSFVKPEDFGTLRYGSDLMNVTFDPTVTGQFASYAFDDTGAPASREYLIRQGILERGLGSLESQTRLAIDGVACARATSWNRPPIDRMANINLEPGETPFQDLIAGVEQGIYMETNRSWSIDDQRHKFQFGCEYAQLIEDGQLTKTVRNPNYRSTTPEFWNSLTAVGDAATWEMYGTPYCGKGEPNQIIRVGHASPVCAFAAVEVFGGAA